MFLPGACSAVWGHEIFALLSELLAVYLHSSSQNVTYILYPLPCSLFFEFMDFYLIKTLFCAILVAFQEGAEVDICSAE